jgi:Kef-type K+ transport system membrane component KefB
LAFSIISDILIVLVAALLVGELFEQICWPSVIGEILSGIIIGPSIMGLVISSDGTSAISSVALFFIIFHIGFEMKTHMVRGKIAGATLLTITSFLVPLIVTGIVATYLFPFGFQPNIIIALGIAIPSISIISVLVMQYRLLETVTGQIALSSATISDVVAFIILAGFVRPLEKELTIILDLAIFVIAFAVLDWLLNRKPEIFKQILDRFSKRLRREDFSYVLLIIVGLAMSVVFQLIGLSYIIGAFFAGLIIHEGLIGREATQRVSKTLSTMNKVFFIPIFFGLAGVEVILQAIGVNLYLYMGLLVAIAMGIGAALTYVVSRKLLSLHMDLVPKQVSAILSGRGAVGIVIASVALSEGAIESVGFSLVVIATLIMSLGVPFLTGRVCRTKQNM